MTFASTRLSRRQALRGAGGLGIAAGLAFAGTGCGGDDDDAGPNNDSLFDDPQTSVETGVPAPGGTLRLATTDIIDYDYQVSFSVLQTLYANRLLRYKTGPEVAPNEYSYVPDLAESWEQPAGDKLIVKLNPAAKFHDKEPVNARALTSEDVRATLELIRTEKPNYVYRYLSDYITSIDTPDPQTVVFNLDYGTPLIFNAIAYYNSAIAPREVIERDGDLRKLDVGTGPFILERYEKSVGMTLRKNPAYFAAPTPYFDEVELSIIPDVNLRLEAFRTGKLDSIDIPFSLLENAEKTLDTSKFTLQKQPGVGWEAYWFNVERPPFNDLRVRQAFGLALDRVALNNLVNQGRAEIRTGPVARGWDAWARPEEEVLAESKRDVAKAKQLLEAAGYPDGFEAEWFYGSIGDAVRVSEVAQQQLKDVGIRMKITTMDMTGWYGKLQENDFSLAHWHIRAYPDPDDYLYPFFYPNGAKNFGLVNDEELSRLILKQRQATDTEERKAVLQEIDRRWLTDFAYAQWYFEQPYAHAFTKRLRGFSSRNPTDYAAYTGAFFETA